MKPFDLEEAKANKPVCTRNGLPVRIICFNKLNFNFPIVALVKVSETKEDIIGCTIDGRYNYNSIETNYDLMMKTEKKTGWISIFPNYVNGRIYPTKEIAIGESDSSRVDTIQIEWEE